MFSLASLAVALTLVSTPIPHCAFTNVHASKAQDGGINFAAIIDCDYPLGYRVSMVQAIGPLKIFDLEVSDHPNKKLFMYHIPGIDWDKRIVLEPNK